MALPKWGKRVAWKRSVGAEFLGRTKKKHGFDRMPRHRLATLPHAEPHWGTPRQHQHQHHGQPRPLLLLVRPPASRPPCFVFLDYDLASDAGLLSFLNDEDTLDQNDTHDGGLRWPRTGPPTIPSTSLRSSPRCASSPISSTVLGRLMSGLWR